MPSTAIMAATLAASSAAISEQESKKMCVTLDGKVCQSNQPQTCVTYNGKTCHQPSEDLPSALAELGTVLALGLIVWGVIRWLCK